LEWKPRDESSDINIRDLLVVYENGTYYDDKSLHITFRSPNASGWEHPCFLEITDEGDCLALK
jgi:hypothetical protein